MRIDQQVVLVTGANRGLGQTIAREFARRGATVYAGARDITAITDSALIPVKLDVTNAADIAAAAAELSDVTVLVNNAGVTSGRGWLNADTVAPARREFEVNVFGPLAMTRAFAPVLAANGGGAIANVLSALSFVPIPSVGSYSASKAAAWSMTNAVRAELHKQGTLVVAVHAGFIDTDMTAGLDVPKLATLEVASQLIEAIEADRSEVLVDSTSRDLKAMTARDVDDYADFLQMWVPAS